MRIFRGHRRKARVLFSATDAVLLTLAFQLAYWIRSRLDLKHVFYIDPQPHVLLLGWSILVWVGLGYWWEIYDRIDAGSPRIILRDAARLRAVIHASRHAHSSNARRPLVGRLVGAEVAPTADGWRDASAETTLGSA